MFQRWVFARGLAVYFRWRSSQSVVRRGDALVAEGLFGTVFALVTGHT